MTSVSRFKLILFISIAWMAWQLFDTAGGGDPFYTSPAREIIHFIFAVIVLSGAGIVSFEVGPRHENNRNFSKIRIASGLLAVFGGLGLLLSSSPTSSFIISSTGLIGLVSLTFLSIGRTAAIIGTGLFILGLFLTGFNAEIPIELTASIIINTWSSDGVFGDGLVISTSYIFIFTIFAVLLRRLGAYDYLSTLGANILRRMIRTKEEDSYLSLLATGLFSGSTTTTLSSHSPSIENDGMAGLAQNLSRLEQASIVANASVYSQFMPPIMIAASFLIARTLEISYLEVLGAALIPATMICLTLVYYSVAAKWRSETVDTRNEAFRLLKGVCAILAMVILVAGVAHILATIGLHLEISFGACITILLFLIAAQSLFLIRTLSGRNETGDIHQVSLATHVPATTLAIFLFFLIPLKLDPAHAAAIAFLYALFFYIFCHIVSGLRSKNKAPYDLLKLVGREIGDLAVEATAICALLAISLSFVGLVVAPVKLMGLGPSLTAFLSAISFGNLTVALIISAVLVLIIGAALPATASYYVASLFLVPILASIGGSAGIFPSLIALHLFILVFACLADLTPPDDIAIEKVASEWRVPKNALTRKSLLVALPALALPFAFVGQNDLFLSEGANFNDVIITVCSVMGGLILIVHVAVGHFIGQLNRWRSLLLLLLSVILIVPAPILRSATLAKTTEVNESAVSVLNNLPAGSFVTLQFKDIFGSTNRTEEIGVSLPVGANAYERLSELGLDSIKSERGDLIIRDVALATSRISGIKPGMRLVSTTYMSQTFDYRFTYLFVLFGLLFLVIFPRR